VRALARELRPTRRRLHREVARAQDTAALRALWTALPPGRRLSNLLPPGPRRQEVWAVTQVKDEADILGRTIAHLLDQGVHRILVIDNGSTDGTAALLADLATSAPVTVIDDALFAYYQDIRMTRLARAAAACGAGWVLPFDADEIWVAPGHRHLAAFFAANPTPVVKAALHNHVPQPTDGDHPDPVQRITHWTAAPVGRSKVAFRAWPLAAVAMGNHAVARPGRVGGGLRVHHFPYRSFEHFCAKVPAGLASLDATTYGDQVGSHLRREAELPPEQAWRRWLALQGELTDRAFLHPDAPTAR
jgi:hypothetical protein